MENRTAAGTGCGGQFSPQNVQAMQNYHTVVVVTLKEGARRTEDEP